MIAYTVGNTKIFDNYLDKSAPFLLKPGACICRAYVVVFKFRKTFVNSKELSIYEIEIDSWEHTKESNGNTYNTVECMVLQKYSI
jgi:hypothetical protein